MKILAFAASSSKKSINKQLVTFAANSIDDVSVEVLDLNDFELPLFSVDNEEQLGQPALAKQFFGHLQAAEAIVISFAEHNGSYSAAYKNIFDWASRIERKMFADKPMVLLATSPGPGGASNVLSQALSSIPHFGGDVKASVSVPSFFDNFDSKTQQFSNEALAQKVIIAMQALRA